VRARLLLFERAHHRGPPSDLSWPRPEDALRQYSGRFGRPGVQRAKGLRPAREAFRAHLLHVLRLYRLRRILTHCDLQREDVRRRRPAEFSPAIPKHLRPRVLAQLAHLTVFLGARLPVHTPSHALAVLRKSWPCRRDHAVVRHPGSLAWSRMGFLSLWNLPRRARRRLGLHVAPTGCRLVGRGTPERP